MWDGADARAGTPPAMVVAQPTNVTAYATMETSFFAAASGDRPLSFEWYFNGQKLLSTGNVQVFSGDTNTMLRLFNVALSQAGSYTLVVTNAFGAMTSAPVQLNVVSPTAPQISGEPESVHADAGGTARITVILEGTESIDLKWLFEGKPIEINVTQGVTMERSADRVTLVISSLTSARTGNYTLRASNFVGAATSRPIPLIVSVPLPPVIVSQPQGIEGDAGQSVELSVKAAGGGTLNYVWFRTDRLGAVASGDKVPLSLVPESAGRYFAQISNAGGAVTSEVATVIVHVPPPVLKPTKDVEVESGATAELDFSVKSFTEPEVEWLFNDVPVTDLTSWQISSSGYDEDSQLWKRFVVSLPRVTVQQSGRYAMRVRTGAGSAQSTPVLLTVRPPRLPVISEMPGTTNIIAGSFLQLSPTVTGTLPLTFEWRKDGANIGSAVFVNSPGPEAAGVYELIVKNPVGAVTSAPVRVTIEVVPPRIIDMPAELTLEGGSVLSLSVGLSGSPASHYQWQFNGVDLPGQDRWVLYIPEAEAQHAGAYTVRVENSAGVVTSPATQVRVNVSPPIRVNPPMSGGTYAEGVTPVLTPDVGGSPPLRYQWKLNGEFIPGATNRSLVLGNIRPSQAGVYSAEVRNSAGSVESSPARIDVTPDARKPDSIDVNFFSQVQQLKVSALVIGRDGRVIVTGNGVQRPDGIFTQWPLRLNEDGGIDWSFGGKSEAGGGAFLTAQPDGKVLANNLAYGATRKIVVGRMNQDGTLDTTLQPEFFGDGLVAALSDGKILVAGNFNLPGMPQPFGLLRLNADGSLDRPILEEGSATVIVPLDDGKVLIGGRARPPGAETAVSLFRLNRDGSWDTSFQAPAGYYEVTSIAVQEDQRILVAQRFPLMPGESARSLARLEADGAVDPTFQAAIEQDLFVPVLCQLRNGKLMVVKQSLSDAGSILVRLRSDGTLDDSFAPLLSDYHINAVAEKPDGAIIVGGDFTRLNNMPRGGIAQLLPEQGTPETGPVIVTPPASQSVFEGRELELFVVATGLPLPEYQWFKGGTPLSGETNSFLRLEDAQTTDAGTYTVQVRNRLGTVQSDAAFVQILSPPVTPGSVDISYYPAEVSGGRILFSTLQPDGGLVIAGEFSAVGGVQRPGLARLLPDGKLDLSFDPSAPPGSSYGPLATQPDGRILAGLYRPDTGFHIVQFDAAGTANPAFSINVGGPFSSEIYVQADGKFFLAHETLGGVARFNADGTRDGSFKPARIFYGVSAMALQPDGKLYVSEYGSVTRLLPNGEIDASFTFPDSPVEVIGLVALSGDRLLVFGKIRQFWWYSPFTAVLDAKGEAGPWGSVWRWYSSRPQVSSQLDGKILVANSGEPWDGGGIRRVLPDGTIDSCFDAGAGALGLVRQLHITPDGDAIVVGDFVGINRVARPGIARLHGGEPSATPPTVSLPPVPAQILPGTNLTLTVAPQCNFPPVTYQWQFAGLDIPGATNDTLKFENIRFAQGGAYRLVASNSLGRTVSPPVLINVAPERKDPGAVDLDFKTRETSGSVNTVLAASDGAIMIGGYFLSVGGVERVGLARLLPDGSVDKTFSPSLPRTPRKISQLPDGSYLLTSWLQGRPGTGLERLNSDGTFDQSFALSGLFEGQVEARSLPTGQMLVWGYSGKKLEEVPFGVARFDAKGSADPQFYNPQRVVVNTVEPQPDGKLVVASYSPEELQPDPVVYRLQADGMIDPTFQLQPMPGLRSMFRTSDGSLLIILNNWDPGVPNFVRLLPDGTLDKSFRPPLAESSYPLLHRVEGIQQPLVSYQPDPAIPRRALDYLSNDGRLLHLLDTTVYGDIYAIAALPDGRLVIGGQFSDVNGVPRDNLAVLHAPRQTVLLSGAKRTAQGFQVSVQTTPGRKYALEYTTSLDAPIWMGLPAVEGNGSSMILADESAPERQRFYRVSQD